MDADKREALDRNDLTTGTVWKKLLLFMLPVLGANLLQSLYGTVDLWIIGRFAQTHDVSAVSTGTMTIITFMCITIGFTVGTTVRIGHLVGEGFKEKVRETVGSAICLFCIIGIILAILAVCFAVPLAHIMNAPEEALEGTVTYLRITGVGLIPVSFFCALNGVFRGLGDARTPLILMIISTLINVVLDLLMVGPMQMGCAGAALATTIAQGIAAVIAFIMMLRGRMGIAFKLSDIHMHAAECKAILKFGAPVAIQESLTNVSFMVLIAILNNFGLVASAGVGVAEKLCALMFLVPGASMAGVSTFAAQNIGAGKPDRARKSMYCGIMWCVIFGLVIFTITFFKGSVLASIFTSDSAVVAAAADYLRSYAVDIVFAGALFSMVGYLDGNGKTVFAAIQGLFATFLVRIPVAFFMSRRPGVTLFQIGFATPVASIAAIVLVVIYIIRMERKRGE